MPEMSRMGAIRTYFERTDECAPNGGRKVGMQELKDLRGERTEKENATFEWLAQEAAKQLGVTLKASEAA